MRYLSVCGMPGGRPCGTFHGSGALEADNSGADLHFRREMMRDIKDHLRSRLPVMSPSADQAL
jgi:hypothetical protein